MYIYICINEMYTSAKYPDGKHSRRKKERPNIINKLGTVYLEPTHTCVYIYIYIYICLFPMLAVGLLDFKVDVGLEADFRDQPPSIPAVPNHYKYPSNVQRQSIPVVPNPQVSLQCLTAEYPCSAQPQSIPTLPNHQVSLQCPTMPNRRVCQQCPTAEYPYTAQLQSIPAVPNHQVSLQCPTAEYQYSCSTFAVLQGRQLTGGRETLYTLLVP